MFSAWWWLAGLRLDSFKTVSCAQAQSCIAQRALVEFSKEKNMDNKKKIKLLDVFDFVGVESDYLMDKLTHVASRINNSIGFVEERFGPVFEQPTFSGKAGEVVKSGFILLDPRKLEQFDDDVAETLIAHELAHHRLKHYSLKNKGLGHEEEADSLARKWGFDVDKLQKS